MDSKATRMDLMGNVQGFMARKLERLSGELAEKYGVPVEEVNDIVSTFLNESYSPALRLAESISRREKPLLLFIGREGCAICRKSQPELEKFIKCHEELELVKLDISQSEGLLYHMILQEERGQLPLIAIIFKGCIRMIYTGECVHQEIYESHYRKLMSERSQNIYAL